jgi:hypothetical protein
MLVKAKNSSTVEGRLLPLGISHTKTMTLMLSVLEQTNGGQAPTE